LIITVPPTGGTWATIKVPYEIAAPGPNRAASNRTDNPDTARHPAPTAVVADDERLMRDQIIGRLKEAWPELEIVGEATNGSEAVALVQSEEPDIVFLDISMPGMDGIQAARAVAGQATSCSSRRTISTRSARSRRVPSTIC
jgi:CheY-like chemotaxis protein